MKGVSESGCNIKYTKESHAVNFLLSYTFLSLFILCTFLLPKNYVYSACGPVWVHIGSGGSFCAANVSLIPPEMVGSDTPGGPCGALGTIKLANPIPSDPFACMPPNIGYGGDVYRCEIPSTCGPVCQTDGNPPGLSNSDRNGTPHFSTDPAYTQPFVWFNSYSTYPEGVQVLPWPLWIYADVFSSGPGIAVPDAYPMTFSRCGATPNISLVGGGDITFANTRADGSGGAVSTRNISLQNTSATAGTVTMSVSDTTNFSIPTSVAVPGNSTVNVTVTFDPQTAVPPAKSTTINFAPNAGPGISSINGNGNATPLPTGSITMAMPPCQIGLGASTCMGAVPWSVLNPSNPRVLQNGSQFAPPAVSGVMRQFEYGTPAANTISLVDDWGVIDTRTPTIGCQAPYGWNGSQCRPGPVFTTPLTASPSSVLPGVVPTLNWAVTDATTCTASGGWTGLKNAVSGSEAAPSSPTSFTSYRLDCTGPGGANSSVTSVTPIEPNLVNGASFPFISLLSGTLTQGQDVRFSSQGRNVGTGPTVAGFNTVFSYSWDNISWTILNTILHTSALFPGDFTPVHNSNILNLNQSGTLYIRYCLDSDLVINERAANEGDNCQQRSFPISPPPPVLASSMPLPASCSIPTNASTCFLPMSWNISNPVSPHVRVNGTLVSNAAANPPGFTYEIAYGTHNLTFNDGATTFPISPSTLNIRANCTSGVNTWNAGAGLCRAPSVSAPSVISCLIPLNANTCIGTVNWTILDPISPLSIRNNDDEFSTSVSGPAYPTFSLGVNTVTFRSNGVQIGSVTSGSIGCNSQGAWSSESTPRCRPNISAANVSPADNAPIATAVDNTFTGSVTNTHTGTFSEVGLIGLEIDRNGDGIVDQSFPWNSGANFGSLASNETKSFNIVIPANALLTGGTFRYRFNVDWTGAAAIEHNENDNRSAWRTFRAYARPTVDLEICDFDGSGCSIFSKSVPYPGNVRIKWTSTGADTCTEVAGSADFSTGGATSNFDDSIDEPLLGDLLFTVQCSHAVGGTSEPSSALLRIIPPPAPTLELWPRDVTKIGNYTRLQWNLNGRIPSDPDAECSLTGPNGTMYDMYTLQPVSEEWVQINGRSRFVLSCKGNAPVIRWADVSAREAGT